VNEFIERECLIKGCDAPASVGGECVFDAVGFSGDDETVVAERITCAAGHFYHVINEQKTVKK
jgi:hypothetical protein